MRFNFLIIIDNMEIQEFIQAFGNLFDETDVNELKPSTKFKELEEWSSITALSVIAMLDEEYNITIGGEQIHNSSTIEELFHVVNTKQDVV